MTLTTLDQIAEDLSFLDDWQQRFVYLIDLGKALPDLPEADRTEAHRVHGCQSSVYLTHALHEGRLTFHAKSDAHIVNGLIAVLLAMFNGKTPPEILQVNVQAELTRLGFEEHLSPTRRNGLHAMIERVRKIAASV